MNPGNGIETRSWQRSVKIVSNNFLLMNPGNGIETVKINLDTGNLRLFPINESRQRDWNPLLLRRRWCHVPDFLLMNPGNGIETILSWWIHFRFDTFPINESRQRDWNKILDYIDRKLSKFPINESRQRDWNFPLGDELPF